MLADVRAGRIDAIVTWQADRLLRTVEDASAIVTIAKSFGTVIANVRAPSTCPPPRAASASTTWPWLPSTRATCARRLRLKHAELAAEGKWEGGCGTSAMTWNRIPIWPRAGSSTGWCQPPKPKHWRPPPRRSSPGGPTAIAIAWNKQGLTTTCKPFTPQKVRDLLLSPKTAGLRYVEGKPVTADWLGIITPDQHQELRAILGPTSRERRGTACPPPAPTCWVAWFAVGGADTD